MGMKAKNTPLNPLESILSVNPPNHPLILLSQYMNDFQHRRNTVGRDIMSNEVDGGGVAPVRKKENWKEICKDCDVLKLDLGCGFGCEIIISNTKKKSQDNDIN
jgi:hypothetical protein